MKQIFSDVTPIRDNRCRKPTPSHSDFTNKKSKVALWPDHRYRPAGVDLQLATWAGRKRSPDCVFSVVEGQGHIRRSGAHERHMDVGFCRILEDCRIPDAVKALNLLVQRGHHVSNNLFYRLLKRCIAHKDLALGRRIHALTVKCGYDGDEFLATHLIGLYASHGRLDEAMRVFSKVSTPTTFNWATIIFAYARHGEAAQAIRLYGQMREATIQPDNHVYVAVLKACATAGDLAAGKEVHAHILSSPGNPNTFVQTSLLHMYAKCRSLGDARRVFDRLSQKNVATWNAMLTGYAQQGMGREALRLYNIMEQEGITAPDSFTFACLLQACGSVGAEALQQGKQLHARIEERGQQADVVVSTCLIDMYAKCNSLADARIVFAGLADRNVVIWTTMIAAYVHEGMGQEALSLYRGMQQDNITLPNAVTFMCLLQACANVGVGALHQGKQLHMQIQENGLEDDVVLGGSLVNMYAKCGSLEDARSVFDRLPDRNVVSWNAMLGGYAQQGMGSEVLILYNSMQQDGITLPDSFTFVCLLQACASVSALPLGKQFHAEIEELGLQSDMVVGTCLVEMYSSCGSLGDARTLFDRLPDKNVVTWTTMLAGYAQLGMVEETLTLYTSMQQQGITPNSVTYVCLLQVCAIAAALPLGKEMHAHIENQALQSDLVVGTALVNMYAKCGSMIDSRQVFDSLPEKTIETWGALIAGYSRRGDSVVVFDLLDGMRLAGIQPNGITFLSVLTVCSHVGLVDKGREYFKAMAADYGISPAAEHYACMIDLLGRSGHLDEALRMAKTMPSPPIVVWLSLLGACQKWGKFEIGQRDLEFVANLDEKHGVCLDYPPIESRKARCYAPGLHM